MQSGGRRFLLKGPLTLEVSMDEENAVSKEFRKQVLGYGLTTAEIVYRRPDRHWLLQTYVWQDYDLFPNFPALKEFLAFWETKLEGFAVAVAHSILIKPAELRAVDGYSGCIRARALRVDLRCSCANAFGKFTLAD
jgi:uncharacterized protein Usg